MTNTRHHEAIYRRGDLGLIFKKLDIYRQTAMKKAMNFIINQIIQQ